MKWPPVITESAWMGSQLSIARHYGKIVLDGATYTIVNKEGKDIFECSAEAEKAGRDMAIEPGEPCDLCHEDYMPAYRKLGRARLLELLKQHLTLDEIIAEAGIKTKTKR